MTGLELLELHSLVESFCSRKMMAEMNCHCRKKKKRLGVLEGVAGCVEGILPYFHCLISAGSIPNKPVVTRVCVLTPLCL